MRFRPCIDIHNGKVKQIVGGSLTDVADQASENFVSQQDAAFYANLYKKKHISGGHVILLNPASSPYYEKTKEQALLALKSYPGGLQVGGGINDENAEEFLTAGASHVVVTSFVFRDGKIAYDHLEKMISAVGKDHLVLDLSCRKKDGIYYIVTDRWQKFTEVAVTAETLEMLADSCDEFLIHAVDVEGKASGIEVELVEMLSSCSKDGITYAGGIGSYEDIELLKKAGKGRVDFTVGSALDLFGGQLSFEKILSFEK